MATPPPADPALLALVAAYQQQTTGLRNRVASFVAATWRSYSRHDDTALAKFLATVPAVVAGGQQQMTSLTTAFLAHQRQLALGTRFKPVPVDPRAVTGAAARNGTPPSTVYARPFHVTWNALHNLPHSDESVAKALTLGQQRAVSVAVTDLQLAKTRTQQAVTAHDDRVRYFRRVLEGPTSCGLCIVASTQRYTRGELMPIHGGCDCGQETVYTDHDPGRVLDLSTLQDVHDRIEQRFGASSPAADTIPDAVDDQGLPLRYRDALVIHEHGELGPVLAVRGQHFRGPADVAHDSAA